MNGIAQELHSVLKSIGVQSLVVDMSSEANNHPFSGRQMLVSHDRLCQHVEIRAKTLHDFIATAQKLFNAIHEISHDPHR